MSLKIDAFSSDDVSVSDEDRKSDQVELDPTIMVLATGLDLLIASLNEAVDRYIAIEIIKIFDARIRDGEESGVDPILEGYNQILEKLSRDRISGEEKGGLDEQGQEEDRGSKAEAEGARVKAKADKSSRKASSGARSQGGIQ